MRTRGKQEVVEGGDVDILQSVTGNLCCEYRGAPNLGHAPQNGGERGGRGSKSSV